MLAELPQGLFLVRPGGRGGAGRGIGLTRRGSAVARRTTATSRQRCLASIQCVGDCDLRRPFFPSEITREYPHSLLMLQVNRRQPGRPLEGLALGLDLCGVLGETLEHVDHVLHLGVRGACRRTAASCARQHDAQHHAHGSMMRSIGVERRGGRGFGRGAAAVWRRSRWYGQGRPPFAMGARRSPSPGCLFFFCGSRPSGCPRPALPPRKPPEKTAATRSLDVLGTARRPSSLLILQGNTLTPF